MSYHWADDLLTSQQHPELVTARSPSWKLDSCRTAVDWENTTSTKMIDPWILTLTHWAVRSYHPKWHAISLHCERLTCPTSSAVAITQWSQRFRATSSGHFLHIRISIIMNCFNATGRSCFVSEKWRHPSWRLIMVGWLLYLFGGVPDLAGNGKSTVPL